MVNSTQTDRLLDPLNRYYRIPLVRALARQLVHSPVRPNQITLTHTGIGILSAVCVYQEYYGWAVILFEVRTFLDSLDGVLARLQNRSTPFGRTLDTVASAIFFNSLMLAGALRLVQDFRNYDQTLIVISVLVFALLVAHSGTVYHLMRRKLESIMRVEVDSVEREWRELYLLLQDGKVHLLHRLGYWLDSAAIRFVSSEWYAKIRRRRNVQDCKERMLKDSHLMHELSTQTRIREFEGAVRATALVSDENVFAIISLSLLILKLFPSAIFPFVHPVLVAFLAGGIYAVFALIYGLLHLHRFLHGVHRPE